MGIWGFVVSGGGTIGVLLGGVLVGTLGWPWIFLVILPIGIVALALCRPLLDADRIERAEADGEFDLPGALLVTASLVAAVYAIIGANTLGWASAQTIILLAVAASLMGLFVAVEARTRVPLVPLGIFRSRNLTVSNVAMVLTVAGIFGWFFFSALYLQRVLGYSSLQTGLAFLPAMLILGALSYSAAAKIVNALLNLARPAQVDCGPVDVNAVINDVLSLLEHQLRTGSIQVRKELNPTPLVVQGIEYKLQQVFLNLFLNARDAMPKGGWLTIATRTDAAAAVVEIGDTGSGIPAEQLSRIYDPFFTTKEIGKGTGLGLSITYGIVQEHEGTITCDSSIGHGTRFTLSLPLVTARAASPRSRLAGRQA
jgi:hypothetical protein